MLLELPPDQRPVSMKIVDESFMVREGLNALFQKFFQEIFGGTQKSD